MTPGIWSPPCMASWGLSGVISEGGGERTALAAGFQEPTLRPALLSLMAELGLRLPGGFWVWSGRSVSYLYTARLSASSWAWGSMGAVGTGVLAAAEGVEMWTAWALEGAWAVAVICRDKREEVWVSGPGPLVPWLKPWGLPRPVLCVDNRKCTE